MNSEATNLQLKTISVTQNEDIHAVKDKSSSCHDDKSKKSTMVKAKTCTFFSKAHPHKKEIRFQVDSSTSMNVIPVKFVADKRLESITKMLQMWSDTTLKPWGSCRSTLHNPKNKEKFSVVFLVVD